MRRRSGGHRSASVTAVRRLWASPDPPFCDHWEQPPAWTASGRGGGGGERGGGAGLRWAMGRLGPWGIALLVAAAVVAAIGIGLRPSPHRAATSARDAPGPSPECEAPGRERVTRYAGSWTGRINDPEPPSDRTYDLRGLRHVGYGSATRYAITIADPGSGWTASRQCVLGGTVLSSVARDRTWGDLGDNYNGDALDIGIESDWAVVDGPR